MELFPNSTQANLKNQPLAYRMSPTNLEEFFGQEHLLGPGKLLRRAIEADRISSLILWGPPGCGKTALAKVIAATTKAHFEQLNAASAKVSDLKEIIHQAKIRLGSTGRQTIVFIDEIHRFNKAQQDVLLPDVESGNIIFIGATIENPFFAVISSLLSRSQIFQLQVLTESDLEKILLNALSSERGLKKFPVTLEKEAREFLVRAAGGDARKALTALEIAVLTTPKVRDNQIKITLAIAQESIQKKALTYDRDGDNHYDIISAFIKSVRGSDPDAAIYWLARMLAAGEDPAFIARRLVILASEDIGNADPQAVVVATACLQAVTFIGLPEARISLAQATTYLASAPKSNASYLAIDRALADIDNQKILEVPRHLRDTHYSGAEKLGHGENYLYPHDFPGGYVKQNYLPEKRNYYQPKPIGFEEKIKERLQNR
jgi:putative ATPase